MMAAPTLPSWRFLFAHPAHFIALGAGAGLSRLAPGTAGTLWAWVAWLVDLTAHRRRCHEAREERSFLEAFADSLPVMISYYDRNRALQYGTYTNLYGCSGAYVSSGYQPNQPVDKVCGCYNWESSPAGTEQCVSANPDWLKISYPWAKLLKDMCPLAYSYAYDDMSSTFTCGGAGDGSLSYDFEFCPGGVDITKA